MDDQAKSDEPTKKQAPQSEEAAQRDAVLELNFVPTWARKDPGQNPYAHETGQDRGGQGRHGRGGPRGRDGRGRDGRGRDQRGRGAPRGRDDQRGQGRGGGGAGRDQQGRGPQGQNRGGAAQGDRRDFRRDQGGSQAGSQGGSRGGPQGGSRGGYQGGSQSGSHGGARGGSRGGRRDHQREASPLPDDLRLDVSFIPDKNSLGSLVKEFRGSMRAYPLHQLAELFLTNHERSMVKLEARNKNNPKASRSLYQCADSKLVFCDREACLEHIVQEQLKKRFEAEVIEGEGPKGIFSCIARCGLSGTLLGPPNHHGYKDAIRKLWRERFSNMRFEDYLARVETVHDDELIAQWKELIQKKTVYRLKQETDSEKPAAKTEEASSAQPDAETEPSADAAAEGASSDQEAEEEAPATDDASSETDAETPEAEASQEEGQAESAPDAAPEAEPEAASADAADEAAASDASEAPEGEAQAADENAESAAPEADASTGDEAEPALPTEPLDLKAAQALIREQWAPRLCKKVHRVVLPSEAARQIKDPGIKRRIRDSWTWENRNHRTILRALRPALKHMRFHLFKVNGGETYVSPVPPRPLDPSKSIDHIKEVLEYLNKHPGSTREVLVQALRSKEEPNSEKVSEVIHPLRWLIERGHVIEYFDGTMAVATNKVKQASDGSGQGSGKGSGRSSGKASGKNSGKSSGQGSGKGSGRSSESNKGKEEKSDVAAEESAPAGE